MKLARSYRFLKRFPLRFSTGDGALPRSGCTTDLSANGLFLNSRALLPPGTHVLGRLELPGGARAEVHAIVAWNRQPPHSLSAGSRGGMGLRLVWAEPTYFQFLAAHC
jgi:hypothetical protein